MLKFKYFVRALRLPFVSASILPFVFGSLMERSNFSFLSFALGFLAVLCTHLSANLINDYADSLSGADWQDTRFFRFFGGSKLIQEKVLNEKFYLKAAVFFLLLSAFFVIFLSLVLGSITVIAFYSLIMFLAWAYSVKPFSLSYRRLGEVVIIILFGPALVMGGYFIQTGIFPSLSSFLLSLPGAFLTVAILFANEVPDYPDDYKSGKFTWVVLAGQKKSFLVYYALISLAFFFIGLNVALGYLKVSALFAFIFISLAVKAGNILRLNYNDKSKLMLSSQMTIALHFLVNIVLIAGVLV